MTESTTENYLFIGMNTALSQYFNKEKVHGLIFKPKTLS